MAVTAANANKNVCKIFSSRREEDFQKQKIPLNIELFSGKYLDYTIVFCAAVFTDMYSLSLTGIWHIIRIRLAQLCA